MGIDQHLVHGLGHHATLTVSSLEPFFPHASSKNRILETSANVAY